MNVWKAMQQELVNIYKFLFHVTPVVAFQVKNWSDGTFCWSFKFSRFLIQVLFFKNFRTFPMICKLSPIEVSFFQRKNWPPKFKNFSQIDGKLRKLCIISKWKAGLSFLRVETDFAVCKSTKTLTSTALYFKNNSRGHMILQLIEIG